MFISRYEAERANISSHISGGSISPTGGGGREPQRWVKDLLFGQIFPENCMKIKEIMTVVSAPFKDRLGIATDYSH